MLHQRSKRLIRYKWSAWKLAWGKCQAALVNTNVFVTPDQGRGSPSWLTGKKLWQNTVLLTCRKAYLAWQEASGGFA